MILNSVRTGHAHFPPRIQAITSASFRVAFMNFRARLYDLLASLPSSTLSAKLLNIVMPMVVADIVDPSNSVTLALLVNCVHCLK